MLRVTSTLVIGLFLASISFADSAEPKSYHESEARVRAAILFGILRFTYWPENTSPDDQINLCVSGTSNIAKTLSAMTSIPNIGSYQVSLTTHDPDADQFCHAHIIGEANSEPETADFGSLLICDNCDPEHAKKTAINLERVGDVVRFDINLDRLEEHGVELSASVIKLANKCSSSNPNVRGCNDH